MPKAAVPGGLIISGYAKTSGDTTTSTNGAVTDISGASVSLALGSKNYTIIAFMTQGLGCSVTDTQAYLGITINGTETSSPTYTGFYDTSHQISIMQVFRKTGQTGTIIVKGTITRQLGSGTVTAYDSTGGITVIAIPE